MLIEIYISALIISLTSLVGVIATWKVFGAWMARNLHYLISFSAGVFLVVALGLLSEVFELTSVANAIILLIFGIIVFFVLGRIVLGGHSHHDPSEHENVHSKQQSSRVLIADGLHNITDGIILVPAFVVSLELGIVVTIGIVFHELVQEVSEFFVLREVGYSTKEALLRNFAVSLTIFVGVIIGTALTQVVGIELGLLGLATGGFFYVVFVDLVPHSLSRCKSPHGIFTHAIAAILGVVVMIGVNMISDYVSLYQEETESNVLLASE